MCTLRYSVERWTTCSAAQPREPAPWWSDGAARGHGGGAEKRKDWDDITCYGCRRRGHPIRLCPEAAQERREEQWHGDQVKGAYGDLDEEEQEKDTGGGFFF